MKRYSVIYFDGDNYEKAKHHQEFIHEFLTTPVNTVRIDDSPFKGVFEIEIGIDENETEYCDRLRAIAKLCTKHNIECLMFSPKSFLAYENDYYITPIKKILTKQNVSKMKKECKKDSNKGKKAFIYNDDRIAAIIPFSALQ